MEKWSSEYLESIAIPDLSPSVLHRRTEYHASRGAPDPPRSTQENRHGMQLHDVPSVELLPPEYGGRCGSDAHREPQGSRTLAESPMVAAVNTLNTQTERVIPELPMVGYHLNDPRKADYSTQVRSDMFLEEEGRWVDLRASTPDEHYMGHQLNRSDDSTVKHLGQNCNGFLQLPVIRAHSSFREDTYCSITHDTCLQYQRTLPPWHYQNGELINFCPKSPRSVDPLVNIYPEGLISEECLVDRCRVSVGNSRYLGDVSQPCRQPLSGLYDRCNKTVPCFQTTTRKVSSRTDQPPQEEEHRRLNCSRVLADSIIEGMVHTIRAQNEEVNALRADMKEMRSRMAKFFARRKKAQQKSLAFIAAVKARMDEHS